MRIRVASVRLGGRRFHVTRFHVTRFHYTCACGDAEDIANFTPEELKQALEGKKLEAAYRVGKYMWLEVRRRQRLAGFTCCPGTARRKGPTHGVAITPPLYRWRMLRRCSCTSA